jgi:hypothetical protein
MFYFDINFDEPLFDLELDVFGESFIFEFEFIELENFFVTHIFDSHNNKPLALGVRAHINWPLLKVKNICFMFITKNKLVAYEVL